MGYRKFLAFITLALFLLIAALPLYGMLIPELNTETGENRALAAWPSEPDPAAIEDWFDDHFALRGKMTQLYNLYNAKSGVDIINGVAIGKDDWLFYMYDGSEEDIKREAHFTEDELATICEEQQRTADYLASKGISYYVMFAPDKHTVYPEFLPDGLSGYEGESRLDGLINALAENTTVNVVDTRQAVIDQKHTGQLFFKTDTHWNAKGAYIGYQELMKAISEDHPNVRIITEDDMSLTVDHEWKGGDMSEFIGQSDTMVDTMYTYTVNGANIVRHDSPYTEVWDVNEYPYRAILIYENVDHPELPSAVFFRDSFIERDFDCTLMMPMIQNSFSRVVMVWTHPVLNYIIENEKPDIVVCETVERYSNCTLQGMDVYPEPNIVEYVTGETPLPKETFSVFFNIDELNTELGSVTGWAFLPKTEAVKGSIHIGLMDGEQLFWCNTSAIDRPDVTAHYADTLGGVNVDGSGFTATFDKENIPAGRYDLIIAIDDGENEPVFMDTRKRVTIK